MAFAIFWRTAGSRIRSSSFRLTIRPASMSNAGMLALFSTARLSK